MKKIVINKSKILNNNRNVNVSQLEEVLKLIDELQKNGIKSVDYDIASPFSKRIKVVSEQDDNNMLHYK